MIRRISHAWSEITRERVRSRIVKTIGSDRFKELAAGDPGLVDALVLALQKVCEEQGANDVQNGVNAAFEERVKAERERLDAAEAELKQAREKCLTDPRLAFAERQIERLASLTDRKGDQFVRTVGLITAAALGMQSVGGSSGHPGEEKDDGAKDAKRGGGNGAGTEPKTTARPGDFG